VSEFCSLENRVALVTGGSRGIGAEIARELGRAGARVAVNYRSSKDQAETVAHEAKGVAFEGDVADPEQAKALVEAVEAELGDIDILVNNAGITRDTLIARMSDEEWREVISTNLDGMFHSCRAVARKMLRRRSGAIVNMSSFVGVHGNPGQTNYAASKGGIIGFTKALAKELGPRGVRVNAIAPGYIETELTEKPARGMARLPAPGDAARPARRSAGRGLGGTVSLLRRGGLRDRRGAPRRRRTGDVMSGNGYSTRRVVVTGLGAVTPLGNDAETYWKNLTAGKSGAAPIQQFDASDFPVKFACELKDFDPTVWIEKRKARKIDRFAQMIIAAARMAEEDSGIDVAGETERTGVSVATGIGGLQAFQDCAYTLKERGADRVNPQSIPSIIPNMGAAWVSMELGTRGPLTAQCTACAASNMAVGEAVDAIKLGRADVMLAGGTEAGITEVGIAGFGAMRALSRRNDAPEKASRPFDLERDGFVMGEAGGIMVVEELEHAKAAGAKIYAEIAGYGLSSDAQHVTEPDPTGRHPARAMTMALDDAGISPTTWTT
jgi:3-oxoacyl-[acyl-carrier-protein] synthase II